jgi:glycosyltransferase involved in cell wall biosynthesis
MNIMSTTTDFGPSSLRTNSPLRIGFFTDFYLPVVSGIAVSLQMVAQKLRAAGHQVSIFAPRFPGHLDEEPMVRRIPSILYLNKPVYYAAVPGTPRTTLTLSRSEFDILHVHSPFSTGMMAYFTARAKRVPLIYTYHTSIVDYTPHYIKIGGHTRFARWGARWFSTATANLCDQVVVPSAKFKRTLEKENVWRPIHTIPNGIILNSFKTAITPGNFRNKHGLKPDTQILLSVGRADPEKRLDFLIEAFTLMADDMPDTHLVIAGDGSARKKLEEQAAATKVSHRIHFLGMVNRADLPGLLHEATVFLTASTTEVHPISVIEAIASGLPLVAVQDEAFEGMIVENENGHLTPLDVGVFSQTLKNLLSNPERLAQYGKRSAELSEKYSIEGQVHALENLYFEAIQQNKRNNFFVRIIPKELNQFPKRITREINKIPKKITNEINKILPGQKK